MAALALRTFVAGCALLLAALYVDHLRETTLPAPTGPFPVGRTQEAGPFTWIWYPAAPNRSEPASYLPAPWREALNRQRGRLLTYLLTRDLSRVRVHAAADVALSPQRPTFPVILMRAGLAALTTDYTALAEDLASYGYVVLGFDAPTRSFVVVYRDGRVVARAPENDADLLSGPEQESLAIHLIGSWAADMTRALDRLQRSPGRFRGRLDFQKVGVYGHSLGGATALQFCHDDPRCQAGIDIDGAPLGSVIRNGVKQPFLFLLSDHGNDPASETGPVQANIHALSQGRPQLVVRGANHYGFSDDGALLKSPLVMRILRALGIVRMQGRRQLAITAHYVHTFFDVYLQGAPAANLQPEAAYPEVAYVP